MDDGQWLMPFVVRHVAKRSAVEATSLRCVAYYEPAALRIRDGAAEDGGASINMQILDTGLSRFKTRAPVAS